MRALEFQNVKVTLQHKAAIHFLNSNFRAFGNLKP